MMDDEFRVGGSLGTTIFQGPKTPDQQPIGIVFNLPVHEARALALLMVESLNAEIEYKRRKDNDNKKRAGESR